MVIESREHSYEIIRKLDMGELTGHYEGSAADRPEERVLMVFWEEQEKIPRLLTWISERKDQGSLSDLLEIIPEGDSLWLIFSYPSGISLKEFEASDPEIKERFLAGTAILEAVILKMLPAESLNAVLDESFIFLNGEKNLEAGFLYNLDEIDLEETPELSSRLPKLGSILEGLFAAQIKSGLYPEITSFFKEVREGLYTDMMECYQEYVKLASVTAEERFPEEKKKKEGFNLFKKLWKHKIIAAVLCLTALLFLGCIAVGPFLWNQVIYPHIESAYLVKTMSFRDPEAASYSGRVQLTDPQSGYVVFAGRLEEGRREGKGKVYSSDGQILFDGQFSQDRYEGMGISYYPDGTVKYEGNFTGGRYDGQGVFHDPSEEVTYEGGFAGGRYDGEGKLWKSGELIYEGSFQTGRYDGPGIIYEDGSVVETGTFLNGRLHEGTAVRRDENGRISYKGDIMDGLPHGQGISYENGLRIYEGSFEHGVYQGEGRLYSPNTGELIYEGGFLEGEFSGTGRLYEPGRQYLIYEGSFRLGQFDGEGKEYDEDGSLRYEGEYKLGLYHGKGVYYEPSTGMVLEEGEFRNGYLATPKALLEPEEETKEMVWTGEAENNGEEAETEALAGAESEAGTESREESQGNPEKPEAGGNTGNQEGADNEKEAAGEKPAESTDSPAGNKTETGSKAGDGPGTGNPGDGKERG